MPKIEQARVNKQFLTHKGISMKVSLRIRSALVGVVVAVTGLLFVPKMVLAAVDCDENAVVYCGFDTKQELINKINNGDQNPYSRSNDLRAIFNQHNINDTHINNAVDGVVTRDGRVLVGGKVVADQAWSVGRQFMEGSRAHGSLWLRPTSTSFMSDNLPALVSLDASGRFRIAILKACGNPVLANPVAQVTTTVQPNIECIGLTATPTNGTAPMAVNLKTDVRSVGATPQTYLYEFGDGTTQESSNASVTHTYTSAGSFRARVRVRYGSGTTEYKAVCEKTITVNNPVSRIIPSINAATPPPPPAVVPVAQVQTPRTGALGIGGVLGGSIITYVYSHYRRSKRALIGALKQG